MSTVVDQNDLGRIEQSDDVFVVVVVVVVTRQDGPWALRHTTGRARGRRPLEGSGGGALRDRPLRLE